MSETVKTPLREFRPAFPYDLINGQEVPSLVVDHDCDLPIMHIGSIHVLGARVRLIGLHQGSLSLHDGAEVTIVGVHQGSTSLAPGCVLHITGKDQGSLVVAAGAQVIVGRSGQQQGSVHVDGRYLLKGTRGGSLTGTGEYIEASGAVVRQPVIRDGIPVYEWRS